MTRAEFSEYWFARHAPLGARIPGLRKFVQSHAIEVPGDAAAADFDGMAELWFDDPAALLAARQSNAWKEATADEVHFVDPTRKAYFVTEEKVIL